VTEKLEESSKRFGRTRGVGLESIESTRFKWVRAVRRGGQLFEKVEGGYEQTWKKSEERKVEGTKRHRQRRDPRAAAHDSVELLFEAVSALVVVHRQRLNLFSHLLLFHSHEETLRPRLGAEGDGARAMRDRSGMDTRERIPSWARRKLSDEEKEESGGGRRNWRRYRWSSGGSLLSTESVYSSFCRCR
jgi:hypothetical protein